MKRGLSKKGKGQESKVKRDSAAYSELFVSAESIYIIIFPIRLIVCIILFCIHSAVSAQVWVESASNAYQESMQTKNIIRRNVLLPGRIVPAGDLIKTESNGSAKVLLPDGTRITISSSSRLRVAKSRSISNAVLLRSGSISVKTGEYRWKDEAVEVVSPVVTAGVRGTEFSVRVSSEGEAAVECLTGNVNVGDKIVSRGQNALASFGIPIEVSDRNIISNFSSLPAAERRKIAIKSLASLIKEAIEFRKEKTKFFFSALQKLKKDMQIDTDEELPTISKLARLVTSIRQILFEAASILSHDREAGLREEILKELLETEKVPPFIALAAKNALNSAERDRRKRTEDLQKVESELDKTGEALFNLSVAASADPRGAAAAGRIIRDGLGLNLDVEPVSDAAIFIASPQDLAVNNAHFRMMRTVRGRTEFRTPVVVKSLQDASGWMITRNPEAFDTSVAIHTFASDTAVWIDLFPGINQINSRHPALYYQFPLKPGQKWTAWKSGGVPIFAIQLERAVTALERITVPAGTWDCLRIETRMRIGKSKKAPLIHVEWIAPGVGTVREIAFRWEYKSIALDERIEE